MSSFASTDPGPEHNTLPNEKRDDDTSCSHGLISLLQEFIALLLFAAGATLICIRKSDSQAKSQPQRSSGLYSFCFEALGSLSKICIHDARECRWIGIALLVAGIVWGARLFIFHCIRHKASTATFCCRFG